MSSLLLKVALQVTQVEKVYSNRINQKINKGSKKRSENKPTKTEETTTKSKR